MQCVCNDVGFNRLWLGDSSKMLDSRHILKVKPTIHDDVVGKGNTGIEDNF